MFKYEQGVSMLTQGFATSSCLHININDNHCQEIYP